MIIPTYNVNIIFNRRPLYQAEEPASPDTASLHLHQKLYMGMRDEPPNGRKVKSEF